MKKYEINLSVKGMKELQKFLDNISQIIEKPEFMQYIGERCMELLKKIAQSKLTTVNTEEDVDASTYMNSMNMEIEENTIYLYNNSRIDTSTRNISPEKRANYPLQLSLAKIVEYGIGYTGMNTNPKPDDWQYDVNQHGEKGWYYKTENGQTFWTNGFEGRLIFYEFTLQVQKYAGTWIREYIEKNI